MTSEDDIIQAASKVCGVDPEEVIRRTSRNTEHVTARIIIAKALRDRGHPLRSIKEKMNYKHYSAISNLLEIAERPERCEPYLAIKSKEAQDELSG